MNRTRSLAELIALALTATWTGLLLWRDWRDKHPRPVTVEPEPRELAGWGEAHRQMSDELRLLEGGA